MNYPLISIIVPVFNAEQYLEECLESLLNQKYLNVEIITIDDGSTDRSLDILNEFKSKDDRVIVLSQGNKGVSSARNRGLEVARGELITFCDSDDFVSETIYNQMYAALVKNKADIVIVSYDTFIGGKIYTRGNTSNTRTMKSQDALREMLVGELFEGHLWNKLYRRELFSNEKFDTDIHICEDLLMNCKLFVKADTIFFSDICLYHYRSNEKSVLRNDVGGKMLSIRNAEHKIVDYVEEHSPENTLYAKQHLLFGYLLLSRALCKASKLDRNAYKELKLEIQSYGSINLEPSFRFSRKLEFYLFMSSKSLYCFYIKIYSFIYSILKWIYLKLRICTR